MTISKVILNQATQLNTHSQAITHNQTTNNPITINSLAPQFLSRIFEHLPVKDLVTCSAVSKSWRKLIAEIEFEELAIYLSCPPDHVIAQYLQFKCSHRVEGVLTMERFRKLKKLIISMNNHQIEEPLIDLSNHSELVHLEINNLSTNRGMFENLKTRRVRLVHLRFLNCYRIDLADVCEVFPNLTHLKAAILEPICSRFTGSIAPLEYVEQYHYRALDWSLVEFLAVHCRDSLRCLTCTASDPAGFVRLVQNCGRLTELNLNIENQHLGAFFAIKTKLWTEHRRLRFNGLPVRESDNVPAKFQVDPDEVMLITYDQLLKANSLTGYSRNELRFYFNNFREIEIATDQQPIQPIKHLVAYDLMLRRIKNVSFHFKNKSSCCYFFEVFFRRLPNVEHLFIAEVENLTAYQLNKVPVLFPKVRNLELHVYRANGRFPLEFIGRLPDLQKIIIRCDGFIYKAGFHRVIKDLKYLSHLELDPVYYELFDFLFDQARRLPEVQCHLHEFTSKKVERPATMDGICFQRHPPKDGFIFEYFNDHNYRF